MPTYQYRCPSCGHEFEEFQSMSEDAIELCPKCGKKTQRLISGGSGFIFKGSGFYETDYKRKSPSSSDSGTSETTSKPTPKRD